MFYFVLVVVVVIGVALFIVLLARDAVEEDGVRLGLLGFIWLLESFDWDAVFVNALD